MLAIVVYLALRELRLRRPDGGLRLFVLALIGLALGLSIGVDLVTLNGDIERMNTVFKFYLHVWVLFALVVDLRGLAASSSCSGGRRCRARTAAGARLRAARGVTRRSRAAGRLGALLYPVFATPARLDDRFARPAATLDGMAYMRDAVYSDPQGRRSTSSHDYEGIQWLRQNVEGTPAIVEGARRPLPLGQRASRSTPACRRSLGWDWHQTQQRGELAFMVDRARQGRSTPSTPTRTSTQALRFLRQYDVEYVILGQVERLYYPGAGLRKFETASTAPSRWLTRTRG